MNEEKICAACGGPIVELVGKEFCSIPCFRMGRAFCKACGKPLPERKPGTGRQKTYCNRQCAQKYYQQGSLVTSPHFEIPRDRLTCKVCGGPLVQPKTGVRLYCSKRCSRLYRSYKPKGFDLTQEWGGYAPETRKVLLELQNTRQMTLAKRLATAITDEYVLRSKGHQKAFTTHTCKTCGKEFQRTKKSLLSKDYCTSKCQPSKAQLSPAGTKNPNARLTWKQVDEIRNLYKTTTTTLRELAKKYGVSIQPIHKIVHYKSWKPEDDPRQKGARS